MKRILALALTLALLLAVPGCGTKSGGADLSSSFSTAAQNARDSLQNGAEVPASNGAAVTQTPETPTQERTPAGVETGGQEVPGETSTSQQPAPGEEPGGSDALKGYPGWSDHVPYAEVPHGSKDYNELSYTLYDTDRFDALCDALLSAASEEDALRAFDAMYDEYVEVDTNYTICYLHYSNDVTNTQLIDDKSACLSAAEHCWDRYCASLRDALGGPYGEALRAYVGDEVAESVTDYEDETQEEKDLREEIDQLVSLYNVQSEDIDQYPYTYNGKEWTYSRLRGPDSGVLSYDEYYKIYDGIMGAMNAVVGETYLKLLAARHKLAQLSGYDNYAQYAYENVFLRDYSPEDAQVFCDSVKRNVGPSFYAVLYSSSMWSRSSTYQKSGEQIMALIGEYCGRLDPRIREVYEYMTQHGYYHIAQERGMMNGAYTTTISSQRAPFIFARTNADVYDISTVAHEFGHACDAYWNQPRDAVLEASCFDVNEIHSTGMEVMLQRYYAEMLGQKKAQVLEFRCLETLLYCVVSGCMEDEFQRKIYENPDITLDEINDLYYQLSLEYGVPVPTSHNYDWIQINHTFESPCYYISYAASALVALQLWDIQQEDPDRALEKYMEILGLGAFDYGYLELLEEVGLRSFAEEGAADEICSPVVRRIRNMG